jgi:hypothetical protein
MEQYISKSAIVAEIRKYIKNSEAFLKYHHNRNDKSVYAFEQEKLVMCDLLSFLDTLEVKEVDLEKELRDFVVGDIDDYDMGLAKHFFELALSLKK